MKGKERGEDERKRSEGRRIKKMKRSKEKNLINPSCKLWDKILMIIIIIITIITIMFLCEKKSICLFCFSVSFP